ncbi:conserved hypothetical protein (plasmid) [Rhizobium leguminosarum bv. trifolii WSM2304]|uniref:Uncharacterized protein n=1 Tax=Rhizobium leguminosarum bv. trifolii (strain WSM2304) TaxID=395492 RepID=A0ABF7QZ08_RHILW|nr:hypothetical protein [Rhizobium leguminosarum]ACI59476.1 conserved hypothetical protein [Rhizobium leguminosarum bv. trifolii WSM2304]
MAEDTVKWMDTVTKLDRKYAGCVVVAGSHGGEFAAYCAARAQIRAMIFNDAGVGKEAEGIYALSYFDKLGVPAATTSHLLSRIGDGRDNFENGVISYVNETARKIGCAAGQKAKACAHNMLAMPAFAYEVPPKAESRTIIPGGDVCPSVVVIDSLALLLPEDAQRIMVAGSHGALLPTDDRLLLNGDALGTLFCDAGFGKDGIGVRRIQKLDELGKPGASVSVTSARIGNGMSVLESGILSFVNDTAAGYGASVGMTAREYVELLQGAFAGRGP